MKLSILIAFLLLLVVTNAYPMKWKPRNTNPWFAGLKKVVAKFAHKLNNMHLKCNGVECPDYEVEVKNKTDDYELRCYLNLTVVGIHHMGKFVLPSRKRRRENCLLTFERQVQYCYNLQSST